MSKLQKYRLKGVRKTRGIEGKGFECNMYIENLRVAHVLDDASGGPVQINFINSEIQQETEELMKSWYSTTKDWKTSQKQNPVLPLTGSLAIASWVISEIDRILNEKKFDRLSKTKTLFQLAGDSENTFRTINRPFSEESKNGIYEKYDTKVTCIYVPSQLR